MREAASPRAARIQLGVRRDCDNSHIKTPLVCKANTMDIWVLFVALAVDPLIGWLDKDSWLLLFEEWPFWLFSIFFGIVGALFAVLLFPTLAGGNIIAAIVVAAIGAAMAVILVKDSGQGIDPDDLPYIFEPFFTTKSQAFGVGLGLSTVYGIMERHNGSVEVTSQSGEGAVFRLKIPVFDPARKDQA